MKQPIQYDHDTLKPTVVATFEALKGVVKISPPDAIRVYKLLRSLVVKDNRCVRPEDAQAYYGALSRLRGTFYEIVAGGK